MADSYHVQTFSSETTPFQINPSLEALSSDHIAVIDDGTLLVDGVDYGITGSSGAYNVIIGTSVGNPYTGTIRIVRTTPKSTSGFPVSFSGGSYPTSTDFETLRKGLLYTIQEAYESGNSSLYIPLTNGATLTQDTAKAQGGTFGGTEQLTLQTSDLIYTGRDQMFASIASNIVTFYDTSATYEVEAVVHLDPDDAGSINVGLWPDETEGMATNGGNAITGVTNDQPIVVTRKLITTSNTVSIVAACSAGDTVKVSEGYLFIKKVLDS